MPPPQATAAPRPVVRQATQVERLAYTRTQAAEALGIGRSTFNQRVLPYVETIEMPWGTKLIPVDELDRLVADRRQAAREQPEPATLGRPAVVEREVVDRFQAGRTAGKSFREIAGDLNASGTPTAHGGSQWWPSTVRGILRRAA